MQIPPKLYILAAKGFHQWFCALNPTPKTLCESDHRLQRSLRLGTVHFSLRVSKFEQRKGVVMKFPPRGGGGGSSLIFVRGCAISEFGTPPFDKARQRRKFDPFVRQIREKVGKNDLKMHDSEDF